VIQLLIFGTLNVPNIGTITLEAGRMYSISRARDGSDFFRIGKWTGRGPQVLSAPIKRSITHTDEHEQLLLPGRRKAPCGA
jgi:hypothetical protein